MWAPDKDTKVVMVTGFPDQNTSKMPSREFIYQLPPDTRATNGEYIEIFPMDKPLQESATTKHREWLAITADQVKQWSPDLVVHVRLDVNNGAGVFKLGRAAPKEGCHNIPDVDRKAFTRAGYKNVFTKPAAFLNTNLDIDSVFEIWQTACSSLTSSVAMESSMKNGTLEFKYKWAVDVKLSDEPTSYTCGYQYYISMLQAEKTTGKKDHVFVSVPKCEIKEEVRLSTQVIEELIKAVVDVQGKTEDH
ncbi:hypothetical protein HBI56_019230 [Parastagonospora nodorum]|nr:hypothetical protein HBH53_003560 [Parastagonospora nodorum]KAH3976674.1 hypothetical protein HBH51_078030 [Parastagonospora nodorum]KAH3982146.1 hypothetical protein HBH52_076450 [Parastagonospora nodorum]KAH4007247.1 hypothetical protein HBI10_005800 [Parastagonospora nodorum]KAH4023410.1 hypothetical protein HBI13_087510 [Parastagonospora nodorum]